MGQDRARQTGYTVSADRPFTGGDDKAVVHWTDLGTERTHSVGPYHHDLVVAGPLAAAGASATGDGLRRRTAAAPGALPRFSDEDGEDEYESAESRLSSPLSI